MVSVTVQGSRVVICKRSWTQPDSPMRPSDKAWGGSLNPDCNRGNGLFWRPAADYSTGSVVPKNREVGHGNRGGSGSIRATVKLAPNFGCGP